ncbi:hypothetical protein PoB_001141600 [Plakobranchus ocellatus]|uniref:Uncharacterized protein n=1 Tax=Plakobranchus ocellatus TaxID=259542 RepID=A0AAV3YRA8_9GAST|nr:hypothetical protein PoB_001141600 [Plakobranchus ocellatus]
MVELLVVTPNPEPKHKLQVQRLTRDTRFGNTSKFSGAGFRGDDESALRSARTLLSRARAPPQRPGLTEGLKT